MRADALFERGRAHPVCQDYGFASPEGRFAVLSDGCSSSPDTDIGARVLCRVAASVPNVALSSRRIVQRAAVLLEALQLDPRSLDATLLYVGVDEDPGTAGGRSRAVIWGDGAIAARRMDGSVMVYEAFSKDSAPPYLSYLLDPGRHLAYVQQGFGQTTLRTWGDPSADEIVVAQHTSSDIERGIQVTFEGRFAAVMVLTDGYRTARDPAGRSVDPDQVLLEMLKVHPGAHAVKRRFKMMQRDHGWVFDDDFGVAALTFLDEADG